MNNDIHEAIQFIISSLEKQGQAPGTLKNYINSFHVFEQYLEENSICEVNERICLEYIQFKTGKKINSFRGTTLDPNLNRRMKPLHLLLMYLETGTFHYEPRKQVQLFQCPSDYLEIYQSFEEYCNARGYAEATKDLNIRHVWNLLLYLESQDIFFRISNFICITILLSTYCYSVNFLTSKFSIISFVRPVYLTIFSIDSPSAIIFRAIPILAFRSALYNACASSCLAFARSLSFSRNSDEAVIV